MNLIKFLFVASSFLLPLNSSANDWPMYRQNAGRTGVTEESFPEDIRLLWSTKLPKLKPAYRTERIQFDAGYEPVVSQGLMFIGSSQNDSVTAYRLNNGRQVWKFQTNGPVRFAPAVWKDYILFGSDDGFLYCLELKTGELKWKKRAVPSDRKVFGNARLISVWPVRGGPVVDQGIVYFAAGVWPFEGVFVYALEVKTGKVIWLNDRLGTIYGSHPHQTVAVGGVAPQGYLVLSDNELFVPCSMAYPARLDRKTGQLKEFKLPLTPRYPGGWFASMDPETAKSVRRGKIVFDLTVNSQKHEDKVEKGKGIPGISRKIQAGPVKISFDKPIGNLKGIEGKIHSVVVADGHVVVVNKAGKLFVFGKDQKRAIPSPTFFETVLPEPDAATELLVQKMVSSGQTDHGYAFVIGVKDGTVIKELIRQTKFHVVVFETDEKLVKRVRKELERKWDYGSRCSVIHLKNREFGLPPYAAELITTEDAIRFEAIISHKKTGRDKLLNSVRPYGGVICLPNSSGYEDWTKTIKKIPKSWGTYQLSAKEKSVGNKPVQDRFFVITREGALPGATNYVENWKQNHDNRVRFPVGLLWFDDTVANFKRSPQPKFFDGIMVTRGKDWHVKQPKKGRRNYPLLDSVYSDVYTGRLFEKSEVEIAQKKLSKAAVDYIEKPQPITTSQYRPPYQKNPWTPAKPEQGTRINPFTGLKEKRVFPKNYGCDGGVDYGFLFTMRSGTPAFYDKTIESGTMYVSGPRSGCTNSVIPANGVLNVPYFFEGCSCSYPLPTSLSLVSMPESHEQWVVWGKSEPKEIVRVGINFGAPGDRMTREGTFWLNYPDVGGPSPLLDIKVMPEKVSDHYRHALWMKQGAGWPWVQASSLEGASSMVLKKLKPGKYTVRVHFSEDEKTVAGERIQNLSIQGKQVLKNFEIFADAGGSMTGVVKEFLDVKIDGELKMELEAVQGITRINGLELIRIGE